MPKTRFKIIPSSYLILIKNNKILLSRRFNTGFMDGYYGLVAGHGESTESFTKTIVREAKEEANISLNPKNLKAVHIMHRFEMQDNPDLRERVDAFFLAKKWQKEIKNMEPEKCDDLSWFPLNKLPANTIPYIKQAINNIQKKIFYSEYGYEKMIRNF
ncbi:MAG: NUDIX domain-containing protein [Patescibacteria group bacterium]|nr:NUDIX domain-containing protein [Patescibacteria group bacterium]